MGRTRRLRRVGEAGGLDGVQKPRLEQGLGSIKLEPRADGQPQEAADLRPACDQVTETLEHLVVSFDNGFRVLSETRLQVRTKLRQVLWRAGIDQEQLILTDDSKQWGEGGSDLDLCKLFEMIDRGQGRASEQIGDHGGDGLADIVAVHLLGTWTGASGGLRHLRQGPRHLAAVKQEEEVYQAPVIVVHDDVFQRRRDRFVGTPSESSSG
jgi:hypothetical protein